MSFIRVPSGRNIVKAPASVLDSGRNPMPWESGAALGGLGVAGAGSGYIASSLPQMYGVSGFTTGNYASTAANVGPLTVVNTTRIVAFRLDALPGTSVTQTLAGGQINAARGYRLDGIVTAVDTSGCTAGGGTLKTELCRAWVAGDVGKCFTLAFNATTDTIEAYLNGVTQGSTGAGVFADGGASDKFSIGVRWNGASPASAATNLTVIGFGAVSSVLTDPQVLAWHDAIVAANEMVDSPSGTTTFLLDAADYAATWSPRTGTGDLTVVGAPTHAALSPTWGVA